MLVFSQQSVFEYLKFLKIFYPFQSVISKKYITYLIHNLMERKLNQHGKKLGQYGRFVIFYPIFPRVGFWGGNGNIF